MSSRLCTRDHQNLDLVGGSAAQRIIEYLSAGTSDEQSEAVRLSDTSVFKAKVT